MKPIINWFEQHQKPCLFKKYIGIDCPGCGVQTSFIQLLKGNLFESIKEYPPLIPIILLFILLILHIVIKYKNGSIIIKYWFIFTVLIIIFSYLYKIIFIN